MSQISFHFIHNRKEFYEPLTELLNKQWPRSSSSRLVTIEKSNDELPLYLIMLIDDHLLVGCIMISRVLNSQIEKSILIENVLVDDKYRGKGYGRLLMSESECIAKEKGYETSYLSTNDKQDFYSKLGYCECEPLIQSAFSTSSEDTESLNPLLRLFGGGGGNLKKTTPQATWMKKALNTQSS
ncbi:hypothetical protein DLAC_02450 [Tieghemostelium lacteum]|uniref:N-acetyltransferase domain-containing protein n=1 Tax=Tieghemostelium lacteum TaxID=361077 RepID=A0A152A2M7_TIELA|nr:hypothetical protein DLAC_02450 [Tieghemostelium lacteum]|eukprot:KYR00454.1 hypothetical protein DLAC_02450 [Tieghemostelium lacteum]